MCVFEFKFSTSSCGTEFRSLNDLLLGVLHLLLSVFIQYPFNLALQDRDNKSSWCLFLVTFTILSFCHMLPFLSLVTKDNISLFNFSL